ncbi:SKP1-like protein 1B [Papaver somniferum]|uniref:SKP1-like protein 1B n=1 Tax=Papaver somniferum TaxID=3469 RepID=UPI000E6F5FAF|nr:SKP1-like protein 1B [Papaver somniferum]
MVGKENRKIVISYSITGEILSKVVEYLSKHAETQTSEEELKIWDEQFVNLFNNNHIVFDVIKAASYLQVEGLVNLLKKGVADFLKAKTPEALRGKFAICNQLDLPGEEEGDEERISQSSTEQLSPDKKKVKIEFCSSGEE